MHPEVAKAAYRWLSRECRAVRLACRKEYSPYLWERLERLEALKRAALLYMP